MRNPARPLEMMDKLENAALATMAGEKVGQHHTDQYYCKTHLSTRSNRQNLLELKSIIFSIKVGSIKYYRVIIKSTSSTHTEVSV